MNALHDVRRMTGATCLFTHLAAVRPGVNAWHGVPWSYQVWLEGGDMIVGACAPNTLHLYTVGMSEDNYNGLRDVVYTHIGIFDEWRVVIPTVP